MVEVPRLRRRLCLGCRAWLGHSRLMTSIARGRADVEDGALLEEAVTSALASTGVEVDVAVVDNASDPPATPPEDLGSGVIWNQLNRGPRHPRPAAVPGRVRLGSRWSRSAPSGTDPRVLILAGR